MSSFLKNDLNAAEKAEHLTTLAGNVQCFDSVYGCVETLERLQIVQATGFLYDEFVFNTQPARAISDTRSELYQKLRLKPPSVLVISEPLFPSGPDNYAKIRNWPGFNEWLRDNYHLFTQRSPHQKFMSRFGDSVPYGYRIYVR